MDEKDSDIAVFLLFLPLYVTDSKNLISELPTKVGYEEIFQCWNLSS